MVEGKKYVPSCIILFITEFSIIFTLFTLFFNCMILGIRSDFCKSIFYFMFFYKQILYFFITVLFNRVSQLYAIFRSICNFIHIGVLLTLPRELKRHMIACFFSLT